MHGNARSSPLGHWGMVLRVIEGEPIAQVARRVGHVPAVRVQVDAPLPGRKPGPVWRIGRRGRVAPPCAPVGRWKSWCYGRGGGCGRGPLGCRRLRGCRSGRSAASSAATGYCVCGNATR